MRVVFNYPKNPHCKGDLTRYDPITGGVMLDLGIYVFQIGSNILKALNLKIEDFDKSNSKIWMKNTQKDKIDFEVTASL